MEKPCLLGKRPCARAKTARSVAVRSVPEYAYGERTYATASPAAFQTSFLGVTADAAVGEAVAEVKTTEGASWF